MRRRVPMLTGHTYHTYNKSIFKYTIFNSPDEFHHMLDAIEFYRWSRLPTSFSVFQRRRRKNRSFQDAFEDYRKTIQPAGMQPIVTITAFCLMPTHIHFQLQQLMDCGIQTFMQNVQNSYTQYFNNRHNRRGPLWQSRFGNNLIDDDLGVLRNSLYIHANPVKDLGVPSPSQWPYSSYNVFLGQAGNNFCTPSVFSHIFFPDYERQMCEYLKNLYTPGECTGLTAIANSVSIDTAR